MKTCWLALMLVTAAASAQSPPVTPESFAHRSRLELGGGGPFHQLTLPLAVYQGAQRDDLGDLRVFNGQGEAVPHALLRSEPALTPQMKETTVPVFPIVASREN